MLAVVPGDCLIMGPLCVLFLNYESSLGWNSWVLLGLELFSCYPPPFLWISASPVWQLAWEESSIWSEPPDPSASGPPDCLLLIYACTWAWSDLLAAASVSVTQRVRLDPRHSQPDCCFSFAPAALCFWTFYQNWTFTFGLNKPLLSLHCGSSFHWTLVGANHG